MIVFTLGRDSPVSAASATLTDDTYNNLASAGTASPAFRTMISPGTSSLASIRCSLPSLKTRAINLDNRRNASIDCSARPSWNAPMIAFIKTTTRITIASRNSPKEYAMIVATNKRYIRGLRN